MNRILTTSYFIISRCNVICHLIRCKNLPSRKLSFHNTVEDREKRLDDSKLKICKNRELGIGNIMGHISNRAQEQFDFYTSVSARAQTFVTDKKLTVTNYDQLLADIAAKKSAAEAAIAKLKADKTSFKCDGTNPTGTLDMFRADGEAQNQALNAYRTSVRSLLAAIKAAAQTSATSPAPVTGSTTNNGVKQ